MCTLILAWKLFPEAALVVAANRDERLDRPASGPRVVGGRPRILMPRDELAGGTWLGLNEHGLFVGITNRAGEPPDPTRRSRGELVVVALRAPDARALHEVLRALPPERHNPFHLLYADESDAFVTWSDGRALTQHQLSPGLHIVTERSLGGDDRGRAERLRRRFEASPAASVESLRALLTIHDEAEPLAGSCIHADALGYGTRSSFIYVSGEEPVAAWSEGHPCSSPAFDLAPELSALFGA